MSTDTKTQAKTTTTTSSTATVQQPVSRGNLLVPPGAELVSQRDLYRELVRPPMILALPLSVTILTLIGLQSMVAMVPVGLVLATTTCVIAARRAITRAQSAAYAGLTGAIPQQRAAH